LIRVGGRDDLFSPLLSDDLKTLDASPRSRAVGGDERNRPSRGAAFHEPPRCMEVYCRALLVYEILTEPIVFSPSRLLIVWVQACELSKLEKRQRGKKFRRSICS
jgi:hypothetical protein